MASSAGLSANRRLQERAADQERQKSGITSCPGFSAVRAAPDFVIIVETTISPRPRTQYGLCQN